MYLLVVPGWYQVLIDCSWLVSCTYCLFLVGIMYLLIVPGWSQVLTDCSWFVSSIYWLYLVGIMYLLVVPGWYQVLIDCSWLVSCTYCLFLVGIMYLRIVPGWYHVLTSCSWLVWCTYWLFLIGSVYLLVVPGWYHVLTGCSWLALRVTSSMTSLSTSSSAILFLGEAISLVMTCIEELSSSSLEDVGTNFQRRTTSDRIRGMRSGLDTDTCTVTGSGTPRHNGMRQWHLYCHGLWNTKTQWYETMTPVLSRALEHQDTMVWDTDTCTVTGSGTPGHNGMGHWHLYCHRLWNTKTQWYGTLTPVLSRALEHQDTMVWDTDTCTVTGSGTPRHNGMGHWHLYCHRLWNTKTQWYGTLTPVLSRALEHQDTMVWDTDTCTVTGSGTPRHNGMGHWHLYCHRLWNTKTQWYGTLTPVLSRALEHQDTMVWDTDTCNVTGSGTPRHNGMGHWHLYCHGLWNTKTQWYGTLTPVLSQALEHQDTMVWDTDTCTVTGSGTPRHNGMGHWHLYCHGLWNTKTQWYGTLTPAKSRALEHQNTMVWDNDTCTVTGSGTPRRNGMGHWHLYCHRLWNTKTQWYGTLTPVLSRALEQQDTMLWDTDTCTVTGSGTPRHNGMGHWHLYCHRLWNTKTQWYGTLTSLLSQALEHQDTMVWDTDTCTVTGSGTPRHNGMGHWHLYCHRLWNTKTQWYGTLTPVLSQALEHQDTMVWDTDTCTVTGSGTPRHNGMGHWHLYCHRLWNTKTQWYGTLTPVLSLALEHQDTMVWDTDTCTVTGSGTPRLNGMGHWHLYCHGLWNTKTQWYGTLTPVLSRALEHQDAMVWDTDICTVTGSGTPKHNGMGHWHLYCHGLWNTKTQWYGTLTSAQSWALEHQNTMVWDTDTCTVTGSGTPRHNGMGHWHLHSHGLWNTKTLTPVLWHWWIMGHFRKAEMNKMSSMLAMVEGCLLAAKFGYYGCSA